MNKFKMIFIGLGILLAVIGLVFYFNSSTAKCLPNHIESLNDKGNRICSYSATVIGECVAVKNAEFTGNSCNYTPKGFLESDNVKYVSIAVGALLIGLFAYYFLSKLTPKKEPSTLSFDPKKCMRPDKAEALWKLHWAKKYGIYYSYKDDKNFTVDETAFDTYSRSQPFIKPDGQWFLRFQVEITKGKKTGVFTIQVSLSQPEDWILGGHYFVDNNPFEWSKMREHEMPSYILPSAKDRLLASLAQSSPERALEFQERLAEREILGAQEINDAPRQGRTPEQQQIFAEQQMQGAQNQEWWKKGKPEQKPRKYSR